MFTKLILIFLFLSSAEASEMTLLEIPLPKNTKKAVYSLEEKKCQFDPLAPIRVDVREELNRRELGLLESIYFQPELPVVTPQNAKFNLKGAKNIQFSFTLAMDGQECVLQKKALIDGKEYELTSIDISYHNHLFVPTLKAINLTVDEDDHPKIISLGPFDINGYFAFYEVNIGMAAFLHTNIRPNDQRRFNHGEPVLSPMPTFLIRYGPLFINQDGAGSLIFSANNLSVLATFLLEGEPYRSPGIEERRKSIYFGPLVKWKWIEALYYRDLRSISHGNVIKLTLAPEFKIMRHWMISPRPGYQHWDGNYVNYYFGVNDREASSINAPTYRGRATSNVSLALRNIIDQKRMKYVINLESKFYGKGVQDSPIADEKVEHRLIAGFLYNFL